MASPRTPAGPLLVGLPDGRRLSIAQVIQRGMSLHQAGHLVQAADLYRQVLKISPHEADALHLLGLVERQQGHLGRALELIQSAIAAKPAVAMYHSNLSDALRALERPSQAVDAAQRALMLDPGLPEAHLNLGAALSLQGAFAAAAAAFEQALSLRPDYADALLGQGDALLQGGSPESALACYRKLLDSRPDHAAALTRIGIVLRKLGRLEEARQHYEDAIRRFPRIPELHNNLSILYQRLGLLSEAAGCLHRLLELRPEDASARHLLAALEGTTTERAPADYVRDVFDGYAETFESHLVGKLGYRTPQLLDETLRSVVPAGAGWDVLDLGCGTGLMGVVLSGRSVRLVGIDIAPKMICKAREKGVYTELTVADILPFMQASAAASYDLVVAADVFVYLGDLAGIFAETRRLLRPNGLFLFSVEVEPDGGADFVLDQTGRYRHGASYLRMLGDSCGFEEARFTQTVIRHQNDRPVSGYLCVFRLRA